MDAARNKDGVFLPKEKYEEQLKAKEVSDNIIREKTLQLKALEEDMEKFNVSYFSTNSMQYYNTAVCNIDLGLQNEQTEQLINLT